MKKDYLSLLYMLNNETNPAKRKEILNYLIEELKKNQEKINNYLIKIEKERNND